MKRLGIVQTVYPCMTTTVYDLIVNSLTFSNFTLITSTLIVKLRLFLEVYCCSNK